MEEYKENTLVESYTIMDMPEDDRPREKAMKHGIKILTNAELMAIIFSTGLKGKSVIQLSEEILRDNENHLSLVARLSVNEFCNRYKGIGKAKAISLLAALELGTRSAADAITINRPKITNAKIAYDVMRHHFTGLTQEEVWILLLDNSGKIVREIKIGVGGVGAVLVETRIILKKAIEYLASSVILFHNHPSGNLTPSQSDDNITQLVVNGCAAIGIKLNDHIIATENGFYSYNDSGRLPQPTYKVK